MTDEIEEPKMRRGIYLLPNLFTTAGLFAGFYAIVGAMAGSFGLAAVAIFIAMIMDGIDGRVARLTNTQSAFGAQYDSLADLVSFGLAPALVMYQWSLVGLKQGNWMLAKLGWLAAFFYVAAAALRLARFNTQVATADKRYFQGLASPAAAACVTAFVWVGHDMGLNGHDVWLPALLITILAGGLMVSNIVYLSFKSIGFHERVPFVSLLLVVVVLILISIDPPKFLLVLALLYAGSGPVISLLRWRRKKVRKNPADQDVEQ